MHQIYSCLEKIYKVPKWYLLKQRLINIPTQDNRKRTNNILGKKKNRIIIIIIQELYVSRQKITMKDEVIFF